MEQLDPRQLQLQLEMLEHKMRMARVLFPLLEDFYIFFFLAVI